MLAVLSTSDIHYLTLLVGVFIAIGYRNLYGVIPGGLIVPGSLVILLLLSPIWFATVLGLSFLVYGIYLRWFRRTDYKRRTPMYVLACLSLLLSSLVSLCYSHWGWMVFSLDSQVGSILPGIIAFNLNKQDVGKVSRAIALCTGLTLVGVLGIASFLSATGILPPASPVDPDLVLQLDYPIIHFFLALGVGYLIYRHQDIRSGGYMVAPLVALILLQPLTAIHFLVGCVLVYGMTQFFCCRTLTVGLQRYVVVLCLSTLYLWGSELGLRSLDPSLPIFQGSTHLLSIAMLSYVNDVILYRTQPILRYMALLIGVSMAGILVVDVLRYLLV
ncbi:MAG: poly-gamma-glutamate biosynthesis protein PgsC/CapC [Cyanobacteria bacterium J06639_14]